MSSGLPDWKLALNIDGQSNGYLTSRPAYGGASYFFNQNQDVAASSHHLLGAISGKGQLYGGYVYSNCPTARTTDYLYAIIDGQTVLADYLIALNGMNICNNNMGLFWLANHDAVNFQYTWGIAKGITFESQFDLYYVNNVADIANLRYHMMYALVS